jgi:hypothetical protein
MIGDGMFSIAKLVATESILSPIMWQWKFFGRHTISDGKISVATSLATKLFLSS